MTFTNVLASLTVTDLAAALEWYERLLGRPADRTPMPGLAEWQVTDSGAVQVFQADEGAGSGVVTLRVADLDAVVRELAVEPGELITGTGARFTQLKDPDGNTIVLAETLGDPSS